jgi:alkylation response protein AidB-like acyl-CoA dehydrogenase
LQLVLSEDQELIAKTAADFVAEKSPIARVRALRDAADPTGFSRPLWKEMAELGWRNPSRSVRQRGHGPRELQAGALGRTLAQAF